MAEKLSKDENIQIQDGWQMNKKKKITYKFKMDTKCSIEKNNIQIQDGWQIINRKYNIQIQDGWQIIKRKK